MKKMLLCTAIYALTLNINSFGMLIRQLKNTPCLGKRTCRQQKQCFALPQQNIFNTRDALEDNRAVVLLEDLYSRNGSLENNLLLQIKKINQTIDLLNKQNTLAIQHVRDGEPLQITQLKLLEWQLHKTINEHFYSSLATHSLTFENKTKGYTNE
jgi:hypothetical protein